MKKEDFEQFKRKGVIFSQPKNKQVSEDIVTENKENQKQEENFLCGRGKNSCLSYKYRGQVNKKSLVKIASCNHKFCYKCIKNYLIKECQIQKGQMQNQDNRAKCLDYNCQVYMTKEEIERVLNTKESTK